MSEALAGLPPAPPAAPPRDAAIAVAIHRGRQGVEVLWVKRARELGFAGGFHALPGGRLEPADAEVPLTGAQGPDRTFRAAAARELFEETGVLAGVALQPAWAEMAEARAAMQQGKLNFGDWLTKKGLTLTADPFRDAGRWVTPPSFPVRFDARLFLVEVPPATPNPRPDGRELTLAEWIRPQDALAEWAAGRALLHAPVLHALEVLAGFKDASDAAARLSTPAGRLEFQKGIRAVPLRTPTLPPATHTNAYVLGNGELLIVDPGADNTRECARLFALLEGLRGEGKRPKAIVLTHRHADHIGGALRVRERLKLPVLCHPETAPRLPFPVDGLLEDGQVLTLVGLPVMRWRVMHTPGHARGHLCLLDEATHALVAGDMVAGQGTILIDPPEGDMREYLAQLERLRTLPVRTLYPAHGPPLADAERTLEEYRAHRDARERKVLTAVRQGLQTVAQIARAAYPELLAGSMLLGERSTRAILLKLVQDGLVVGKGDQFQVS